MLEPISHADLFEDVYLRLRHAIFTGTLGPGERLVEDQLAQQLGVSRAPVRDALKALEHDGLVVAAGRRGKVVSTLSAHDVWEVYSLRSSLEAMAIRLAIPRADASLMTALEALVGDMRIAAAADDLQALSRLDVSFHEAICRASGHERLLRAWESMSIQIRLLSLQVIDTLYGDLAAIPARHELLIVAMQAGDAATAEQAIRAHIDSVAERVTSALEGAERRMSDRTSASGMDGEGMVAAGNVR